MSARTFTARLQAAPAEALGELEETVVAWGGEFQDQPAQPGTTPSALIQLPVRAGIRYGWVAGAVRAIPDGHGAADHGTDADHAKNGFTRLEFTVDDEEYRVDKAAFGVLLLAAAGALVTLVAPLVPHLVSLVPVGILLAVGAWFFIIARLRNSGPEELFDLLDEMGDEEDDDSVRDRLPGR
ncbi:MAG: hypothetical protein AAGC60_28840 [Acidobacteriota bacterium]